MKRLLAIAAALCAVPSLADAQAAEAGLSSPIEVALQLGTADGGLVIEPDRLTLQKGNHYKLVLSNPSGVVHQFVALDPAAREGAAQGRRVWQGTRNWWVRPSTNFATLAADTAPPPGDAWVVVPTRGTAFKMRRPSAIARTVAARDFAANVRTTGIAVDDGTVEAEKVWKGTRNWSVRPVSNYSYFVRQIEVAGGGTAEWSFVPLETGVFKFGCASSAHAEAGMRGTVAVM